MSGKVTTTQTQNTTTTTQQTQSLSKKKFRKMRTIQYTIDGKKVTTLEPV